LIFVVAYALLVLYRNAGPAVTKESAWPYVWMLLGCAAFALMGQCAHALGDRCDWQFVALARSGLALLFGTFLALAGGARLVFFRPRTLWLRSLAGSVSLLCTFFALAKKVPTADVLTLTNMFPIWVALFSWPLLGETPPGRVWLGTAAGIVGVAFIQQPHLADGNLATFVALGGSFSTALAMIGLHRLQGIDTRAIVVHFSAVALVLCAGSVFLFDRSDTPRDLFAWPTLLLLLGVGVVATLGQLCLTKAFATGNPARVSVVGLSQVVFALAFDVLLWKQPLTPGKLLGLVLILVPSAWMMRPGPHPDSGSMPAA
jgi:drug/metabolite transporter (DMT)-like permease